MAIPAGRNFASCYMELCKQQRLRPLPVICVTLPHSLDFTTDRIKMDDWGPILNSLSLDRSLKSISVHSRLQINRLLFKLFLHYIYCTIIFFSIICVYLITIFLMNCLKFDFFYHVCKYWVFRYFFLFILLVAFFKVEKNYSQIINKTLLRLQFLNLLRNSK